MASSLRHRLGILGVTLVTAAGLVGAGSALAGGTDTPEPANLSDVKQAVETYHDSGSWDGALTHIDGEARDHLQFRLDQGVEKPALVLDVDDTSLSTYAFQSEHDFGYDSEESLQNELEAKMPAIKPTLDLVHFAEDHGVAVFYVTGRRDDPELRAATAANLVNQGFPEPDGLYLRPAHDDNESVVPYKSGARAEIEQAGHTILGSIGDQRSDLDGGHAEKIYKLPNPMYSLP